jgi:hypothetical protein
MVRRHTSDDLLDDVALAPVGRDDAGGAGHRQVAGNLQCADAAPAHEHPQAAVPLGVLVLERVGDAAPAGERAEARDGRDCRRTITASGHDHVRVGLLAACTVPVREPHHTA